MSKNHPFYQHGSLIFVVDCDSSIRESLVERLDQYFKHTLQYHEPIQLTFKLRIRETLPDLNKQILHTQRQKFIGREYITVHEGKDFLILQTDASPCHPITITAKRHEFYFFVSPSIETWFLYILRFIQEAVYTLHEHEGWVAYHASLVTLENQGVLILGPSHAGKTTLLSYLCIFANAGFIGNESIVIKGREALYDPFPLSFRKGTIKAISKLSFERHYFDLSQELEDHSTVAIFSPLDFSKISDVDFHAECKIARIIITNFQKDYSNTPYAQKIESKTAHSILLENCISTIKAWNYKKLINADLDAQEIIKNADFQSDLLSQQVPAIKLTFGSDTNPRELVNIIKHC